MPVRKAILLAAVIVASLSLQGCIFGAARGGLAEVMKHCTAYGPLKMGVGGPGFGAAFACGTGTERALQPRQ